VVRARPIARHTHTLEAAGSNRFEDRSGVRSMLLLLSLLLPSVRVANIKLWFDVVEDARRGDVTHAAPCDSARPIRRPRLLSFLLLPPTGQLLAGGVLCAPARTCLAHAQKRATHSHSERGTHMHEFDRLPDVPDRQMNLFSSAPASKSRRHNIAESGR
jgi:hypothetical protein